jgi:hypothetical protein
LLRFEAVLKRWFRPEVTDATRTSELAELPRKSAGCGMLQDVPGGTKRSEGRRERRADPVSVVKVFPPFVVGVADHAHDVAAGVQGKGAGFAQ